MYKHHIITKNSIIVICDNGSFTVNAQDPQFENIRVALHNKEFNKIPDMADKKSMIASKSNGKFMVVNGAICYKSNLTCIPLPAALNTKVMQFINTGTDVMPLIKFWENARRNPNIESRNDLYVFIEHNKIAITEDGCFICYKAVGKDYMDIHSHTFDNHPGKTVYMPREQCDTKRENVCSFGLHVCGYDYIPQAYDNKDNRIIEVLVNPRHVVSVPIDYKFIKMRVSQYTVLNEFIKEEDKPLDELVYNKRTYYYKGKKGRDFAFNLVTGRRPSRFYMTCRASTTEEAIKKLKGLVNNDN